MVFGLQVGRDSAVLQCGQTKLSEERGEVLAPGDQESVPCHTHRTGGDSCRPTLPV